MNKLLTEDLLNQIRLMKYDRSKVLNEQVNFNEEILLESELLLEGDWDSTEGDNRYWIALFDRLKSAGINVKYGDNGKQVTDPKTSTFMYWGKWIIWKDLNKGNGWPIQYLGNSSWFFKFKNKKYKGESLDKTEIVLYSPATVFKLSDFIKLNDLEKNYDKIKSFCQQLKDKQLIGGIDIVKAKEESEKYPNCFKKDNMKDIPKDSPLYKELDNWKIDPETGELTNKNYKKPDYDYGVGAWTNLKDQSDNARMERYKKSENIAKNIEDLIYLPEYGNDKIVEDVLKNSKKTFELNGITFNLPSVNGIELGYKTRISALENRKKLKSIFKWTSPDEEFITELDFFDTEELQRKLTETSLSTVINADEIFAINWVDARSDLLRFQIEQEKIRRGLDVRKLEIEFLKTKPNLWDGGKLLPSEYKYHLQTISDGMYVITPDKKNYWFVGQKGGKIYANQMDTYRKELKNFVDKKINDKLQKSAGGDDVKTSIETLISKLQSYESVMKLTNEWNKRIIDLKASWLNENKACDGPIAIPYPGYATEDQINAVTKQPFFVKLFGGGPTCSNKLEARVDLKSVCSTKKNMGVFITKLSESERIKFIRFDWKEFNFKISKEKKPNALMCMCANPKILEYDTEITVKGEVGVMCTSATSTAAPVGGGSVSYFVKLREGNDIKVRTKEHIFKVIDTRSTHSQIYDWGKKCFTGENNEGEAGKDFHCLIDVASIGALFIPTFGPLISALFDLANATYYVIDAIKADNDMDRNSALFSAGMSLLSSVITGLGELRAATLAKANGKAIVGFSDEFIRLTSKIKKVDRITEIYQTLVKRFKLTKTELEFAEIYIKSLKNLTGQNKLLYNYVKSVRNLKGKLGLPKWGELMTSPKFRDYLVKNNGNVLKAINQFSRNKLGKELLTQVGFFVAGEAILPGIIEPLFIDMIKSGKWGTIDQQISSNNYNTEEVLNEFMIDKSNLDRDMKLLSNAWNEKCSGKWKTEKRCLDINGQGKPWRPGYLVPEKYQTVNYKKNIDDALKNVKEMEKRKREYDKINQVFDIDIKDNNNKEAKYSYDLDILSEI